MTREERIDKLLRDLPYKAPEMWREVFEDFYYNIQTDILNALESYLYDIFNTPTQVERCMDKIEELMEE